jgi:putative protein-disulfide isomerase
MIFTLIYCFDAYCNWCYGFSPVIRRIAEEYKNQLFTEVLSGGMILSEKPRPISIMAIYNQQEYRDVEKNTGIKFGEDWLWHIFNPDKSDWFPDSEKPAIALCIFKEYYPGLQVSFASDLQYALHYEGRDLCDDEAYRHLLEKYAIPAEDFYSKLHHKDYKEKAASEFGLIKQLKVDGFPTLLLQQTQSRFHLLTRGYADYEIVKEKIDIVLKEINPHL